MIFVALRKNWSTYYNIINSCFSSLPLSFGTIAYLSSLDYGFYSYSVIQFISDYSVLLGYLFIRLFRYTLIAQFLIIVLLILILHSMTCSYVSALLFPAQIIDPNKLKKIIRMCICRDLAEEFSLMRASFIYRI